MRITMFQPHQEENEAASRVWFKHHSYIWTYAVGIAICKSIDDHSVQIMRFGDTRDYESYQAKITDLVTLQVVDLSAEDSPILCLDMARQYRIDIEVVWRHGIERYTKQFHVYIDPNPEPHPVCQ